ncbi:VWA domain-containing protein [Candidatus Parcubacteria bacterium]|nr:VWA domain-containing protein [Candidatus Parcubacteria bacterium]
MQYFNYVYKFLQNQKREKVIKKIAFASGLLLVFQMSLGCLFFMGLPAVVNAENDNLCEADVDVVLIIDRSGSMEEGAAQSKCEWTEIKEVAGQGYYTWFLDIRYDETEQWCMDTRDQFDESSAYYSYKAPTYTPAANSKIVDAKDAAKIFLGNLGQNDQSALVSFADNAILNKTLSDNHMGAGDSDSTEFAVNALIADGATNIGDAIALANTELGSSAGANPQAVKVIILLTDGKANKPDGNAVQHAKDMADLAALSGYKIFTIGLGDDADAGTLQYIADATNGEFYSSPTSGQLAGIYQSISQKICEYGSISGCKYQDSDPNDDVITGNTTLAGWEIILTGGVNGHMAQETDQNGCYQFSGLPPDTYVIIETLQAGWIQTYAPNPNTFTIDWEEHINNVHFGNYEISDEPATSSISGYKYNDLNNNGLIDEGGAVVSGWEMQLIGCPYLSGGFTFLDKSNINLDPASSTPGACNIISTTTTDSLGFYEFTNLTASDYGVSEASSSPWLQTYPVNDQFYYFNLGEGTATTSINFANYYEKETECTNGETRPCQYTGSDGTENVGICRAGEQTCANGSWGQCDGEVTPENEICGNGIDEDCNGSDASCGGGGGGGGSVPQGLIISNEQAQADCDSATITWLTNKFAGSRVVYDTVSHSDISGETKPNYGYAFSSDENFNMVTGHSVEIAGLNSNTTYYFRPISNYNSIEKIGKEIEIALPVCAGGGIIVLGEEGAPVLTIAKTVNKTKVNPGEKDIEFSITVKNEGSLTAFNVKLNDILPPGISFQDFDSNIKDWDLGDINPGEEAAVKYMAEVSANAAAKIYANNASASADNHESVTDSASLEVERVIVLAETGFKLNEFIILFVSSLTLAGSALFIRSKQTA